jgi:hypothetical protein
MVDVPLPVPHTVPGLSHELCTAVEGATGEALEGGKGGVQVGQAVAVVTSQGVVI